MTIHYENYKRFSKGQGFAGVLCAGLGAQVSSKRFFATDCMPCKEKVVDKVIVSRHSEIGLIEWVEARGAHVLIGQGERWITWREMDDDWAPLDVIITETFND